MNTFINFNSSTASFRVNTFRNNGDLCGTDSELMECIDGGSDATCSVDVAKELLIAHNEGDYRLESHVADSLSQAISEA